METAVEALGALVRLCRLAHAAASVSIARVDDHELVFVAAEGEGAEAIVGTRLPMGAGLAGYVAISGQALEVAHVVEDPRFAREVAEATGYVPDAILLAPAIGPEGEVVGVLSVLDRRRDDGGGHALEMAGHAAEVAATLLGAGPARGDDRGVVLATAVAAALDSYHADSGADG